jgi:hypothetical protein
MEHLKIVPTFLRFIGRPCSQTLKSIIFQMVFSFILSFSSIPVATSFCVELFRATPAPIAAKRIGEWPSMGARYETSSGYYKLYPIKAAIEKPGQSGKMSQLVFVLLSPSDVTIHEVRQVSEVSPLIVTFEQGEARVTNQRDNGPVEIEFTYFQKSADKTHLFRKNLESKTSTPGKARMIRLKGRRHEMDFLLFSRNTGEWSNSVGVVRTRQGLRTLELDAPKVDELTKNEPGSTVSFYRDGLGGLLEVLFAGNLKQRHHFQIGGLYQSEDPDTVEPVRFQEAYR